MNIRTRIIVGVILINLPAFSGAAYATVMSYTKDSSGVQFFLDKGVMRIDVCKEDVIEVRYTSLTTLQEKKSLIISNDWKPRPPFQVSDTPTEIVLATRALQMKVTKATNAITYCDPGGATILAEDALDAKQVSPATVAGISTYTCSTEFLSPNDEALYGLGCHPEDSGSMNYTGRNQDLAIKYMTGAMPVLLSTRGYGLMWDNYSASNFFGAEGSNTKFKYVSESGTMVDYYFFYGPEFDHIIASYRLATGRAPMFPKWAFGLFQSQDRYQSQSEVLSVKDNYRNNSIPVDCIVQDWFYWEPNVIGSHVMDPGRYPNPKTMVDSLHAANIHGMISVWPVYAPSGSNYDELKNAGGVTTIDWGNVMHAGEFDLYYDTHDSLARDIYWRQVNTGLISRYGWDAVWVDQCEPDNGDRLDLRRQATFATGRGIDYFNTYSLMHTTGLYTHWRNEIPGKRAFFLVRQAWAGQQRNAATLWSSDITCTFGAYKIQVPQGINACISGIPYWTSDIGGYHLNWNAPQWSTPSNRELFTRWFQFGTFCPIFRIHGKGERALFSNNWDAATKRILLNYDNLRYRLLPYIYSLAWKVTSEGSTIMRGLAFDFRTDQAAKSVQDQYMFGPAFLVNPVTAQTTSRQVYLPAGTAWYDFWTGEKLNGGSTITAPAPIEKIPLYVKAGSIVPMGPYMQYATEKNADTIEVRVYPGADGQFTIYEDANEGYEYESGHYSLIPLTYHDATHHLTIGTRVGTFPNMPGNRVFRVIYVGPNHGTGVEMSTGADVIIDYKGLEISSVMDKSSPPKRTQLEQNYPNPFNPSTKISYYIQRTDHVSLKVFDSLGQEVATLVDTRQTSGEHTIEWDAGNFSSGVYFCRLQAGEFEKTNALILIK